MTHLTFTGPYAGQTFCGVPRCAADERGDTLCHVPYSNVEAFLARPEICPECKRLYERKKA